MLAAVSAPPAFPSRGVPLRVSSAGRGRCSNLPFHAKLLHGHSSASAAAFHVAAPAPPRTRRSDPSPFSRNRLPHATAWRDPPESPQRVPPRTPATRERRLPPALNHHCGITRHRLQHLERLPLGDSVRQPMPISNPSPFFRNRIQTLSDLDYTVSPIPSCAKFDSPLRKFGSKWHFWPFLVIAKIIRVRCEQNSFPGWSSQCEIVK